jgi:hypothetical protein
LNHEGHEKVESHESAAGLCEISGKNFVIFAHFVDFVVQKPVAPIISHQSLKLILWYNFPSVNQLFASPRKEVEADGYGASVNNVAAGNIVGAQAGPSRVCPGDAGGGGGQMVRNEAGVAGQSG